MALSIKKIITLLIIFASILLGLLLCVSPGSIFCIFLTLILFYLISKNTPLDDRKFVISIIGIAIMLRLIALVYVQYYCYTKGIMDIFGDAHENLGKGYDIRNYLKGEYIPSEGLVKALGGKSDNPYNVHGLTFFNGIFYTLFGKEIISLKYINILSVAVSGWFVYHWVKKIYSPVAGKIAMITILYWPTLFVWSITDLKESHLILAIIIIFWCLDKIITEKDIKQLIVFSIPLIISSGYAISLRNNLLLPLLLMSFVAISVYFSFIWYLKKKHGIKKLFIFISISGILIFYNFNAEIYQTAKNHFGRMIASHIGYLGSGGFNYNLIENSNNYYTIPFFIKYFIGAWYHFLLEPLPWHIFSLSMLVSYPAMIVWYIMLALSIVGIMKIGRIGKMKEIFPALTFTILYITVVGMSVANIGTAVRFRDAVMPFITIFASCGMANSLKLIR